MMRTLTVLVVVVLAGCAHLGGGDSQSRHRSELWAEAHLAFHAEDFRHARESFRRLADEHPDSGEGREALFYLGTLSLDPRNPEWDPEPAAEVLREYLALDTARAVIQRRPEATTLLRLADQLIAPPPPRQDGPEAPAAGADTPPRNVASNAEVRALQSEVETLRRQLAERDSTIQRQREELERIRRVLAPRTPSP